MRIYCPPENITRNTIIILDKGQIRHLSQVMRLKVGGELRIFDGQSREYDCVINAIASDRVTLAIQGVKKIAEDKSLSICLACAIPKRAKIDFIIEKAVELGVDRIIPLQTERTIVKVSHESAKRKLKRWQAIAREAAKQCGRITLPVIEPVALFKDALGKIKEYDLSLIPNLGTDTRNINEIISNFSRCSGMPLKAGNGRSIIIFIGPEGDFSESEIALSRAAGCRGVSLGDLTLKVDTAAIATIAFLRLFYLSSQYNV